MLTCRIMIAGVLVLATVSAPASADRIILRGGGQIKGKLLAEPDSAGKKVVITERGKAPVTLRPEQILQVVDEPGPLDAYVLKRNSMDDTALAQYDLGLWCETVKLRDLAEFHHERAVAIDPEFVLAHQKLGHVLHEGKWLTADELKVAKGMVKIKGRWVTQLEKDKMDAKEALTAEQTLWVRDLSAIRNGLFSEDPQRRIAAEAQMAEIDEPIAIRPLIRTFAQDPSPIRSLLARVLGKIRGVEAAVALVDMMLAEADQDVRQTIVLELKARDEANIPERLKAVLTSENPAVVNRAAWTLGQLNAKTAVPKLANALTTTEYRVEMYQPATAPPTPAPGFFSGSTTSIPILTGPVVGNGVAAYGATSVPFQNYGATSIGGGAVGGGTKGPVPVLVPYVHQNIEVLAALQKLTGQNFGYDSEAWKRWIATQFQAQQPTRRVAQP